VPAFTYIGLSGWSGRLKESTTGHSFGTYIINVKTCSIHICSLVPTSLTKGQIPLCELIGKLVGNQGWQLVCVCMEQVRN